MADPLPPDPLRPTALPPPDATVADGTVRPDGTVAAPSDYDRLRRAFATDAGIAPTTPLPISAESIVRQTRTERINREAYYSQNDMPSELDLALSRYVPLPSPEAFKPQTFGPPLKDNPPTGTLLEGLKAGFSHDTLIGAFFEHQERKAQIEHALGPIKPVQGYSAWQDPQLASPERRAEMWRYVTAQSPQEAALRISQSDERRWDEMTAAQQGTAYTIGRLAGGLADPTLLLTSEIGFAEKAIASSRILSHTPIWGRLARGIELGSINMAQAFGVEAAQNYMDPSYTSQGLGDMMLLAGGIGFTAGALTRGSGGLLHNRDAMNALNWEGNGHYRQLLRSAPDHPLVRNPAGGFFGMAGDIISAGAAATPYMAASHWLDALEGEGLKSIFGLEKFGLTPVIRLLAGESLIAREFASNAADLGGLKQNKNVWSALNGQQKTAFPVESETAVRWKAKATEHEQGIRQDWLQGRTSLSDEAAKDMAPFLKEQLTSWLRRDGNLSFNDFIKRAGRAVANGNKDLVEDAYTPFVEKSARRGDSYLKELRKHAEDTGLFKHAWEKQIKETRMELAATTSRGGEERRIAQLEARLARMEEIAKHGPQVNTGPNYFPRIYRHDEIVAREDEWQGILGQHFRGGGMSEEEARSAAASVTSEITHSNFRPIYEDNGALIKQASDPGSARFRTLEIPDDKIADFLDWDLIGAIRHQTATMAPAIEMMRRWGDPSLTGMLGEVQGEYEQMIAKETSGTRRVELQNNMKRTLEDMQAVRDRLLNVAGASKDPHSWSERTIRMLKHYTAWTTLGLSAVSQLGDLFRPVITEGIDAVHRYGLLTLMDSSRAEILRMAQRERMMSGDAWELATAANALSFTNIGDTYSSRSRLERQANQLSGAYFMLNGLTAATDLTKQVASVIIQGNLNHEIMAWGRSIEAEALAGSKTSAEIIAGLQPGAKAKVAAEEARTAAEQAGGKVAAAPAEVVPKKRLVDMEFTPGELERAEPTTTSDMVAKTEGLIETRPRDLGPATGGAQKAYAVMPDGRIFEISNAFRLTADEKDELANINPMFGAHSSFFARYPDMPNHVIRLTHYEDSIAADMPQAGRTSQQTAALRRVEAVWKREGKSDKFHIETDDPNAHLPAEERVRLADEKAVAEAAAAPAPEPVTAAPEPRTTVSWADLSGTPVHEQTADKTQMPSKLMLERLHSLSIDSNDALAIYQMLKEHGKAFNSIHMANSDAWTDKEAQMLYRGALGRAINRTVITPGIIDRPTWMTTSVGSLIGQFKAFGMASTIRTLGAGLQDNDRQFWTGAAVLVGSGVVLNELRSQLFYGKSSFDQPYLGILADGLDRSGVLGSLMDVNNAVETVSNNKLGMRPLVGAGKNMPVTPQKFADTFFGPAAGKTVAAGKTIGEIMSGNADARTWRDMRGFVPGQNLPYIDPIADLAFPRPAPQRSAKDKKKPAFSLTPEPLS